MQIGKNYGWNKKEGSFLFNPAKGSVSPDPAPSAALVDPIAEYSHQDGTAVFGGFVYRGAALPALVGKYVFAELTKDFSAPGGRLLFLDSLAKNPVQEFQLGYDSRKLGLFVKGIGADEAGEIYILADSNVGPAGTGGRVLKLVPAPASPALLNLSTRQNVGTGEDVLIGGFIVVGSAGKPVVLRGVGPSLKAAGEPLPGRMADPFLELHDGSGATIASNNNWVDSPQKQQIIATGIQPTDDKESTILGTLNPGVYTAVLRSATAANGIGLVELYDLGQSVSANAVNISTRGVVKSGDEVMIGGFIVGGSKSRTLVARAIGPSLAASGVNDPLQNPTLELHNSSGTIVASNDDWRTTQEQQIRQTGIAPRNDKESAILTTLAPGAYTAVISGVQQGTGVALVEVYQVQ